MKMLSLLYITPKALGLLFFSFYVFGIDLAFAENEMINRMSRSNFEEDFLTSSFSVLCRAPFQIDEGEKAALSMDEKWLKESGCILAGRGLRVKRISTRSTDIAAPWEVRVYSKDGTGFTLWGSYKSFVYTDNVAVPFPRH